MRADTWLVQQGFFPSRQRAQWAIREGLMHCNGIPVKKPSQIIQASDDVQVLGDPLPYVGRGGLKLEKAIRRFSLDFKGKRVLDAGASTGGFTDCALQHGAARVYAVDVGADQLAEKLREDPRVLSYENQDIRNLTLVQLEGDPVDLIVADLSFISLTHILPVFPPLLKPTGGMVLLIKPQFEQERRQSLKRGILREPPLREAARKRVLTCAAELGFHLAGMVETDVEDEDRKNIEYLVWLVRD